MWVSPRCLWFSRNLNVGTPQQAQSFFSWSFLGNPTAEDKPDWPLGWYCLHIALSLGGHSTVECWSTCSWFSRLTSMHPAPSLLNPMKIPACTSFPGSCPLSQVSPVPWSSLGTAQQAEGPEVGFAACLLPTRPLCSCFCGWPQQECSGPTAAAFGAELRELWQTKP